ncbi:MAG: hypothetical protein LBO07_07435 [Coriobacteriales bacterium]|nr:hypothetical protein [Coriobacteriales bacterium]
MEKSALDFRRSLESQLAPYRPYLKGEVAAHVVLVKGVAGAAEWAGRAPFSGEDGEALEKALVALGWPKGSWCGILVAPVAPPGIASLQPGELRLTCEIIDPQVIVALDEPARQALAAAFGPETVLAPGAQTLVQGRNLISVAGFEEALGDANAKQRVWAQLKRAVPPHSLV